MKITHIIPAAFTYFDDIRDRAFSWVEALGDLGLNVDVFTLQYSRPTAEIKEEVKAAAPSRVYSRTGTVKAMINKIAESAIPKEPEIIHMHTPFLGGAGAILNFVKSRPSAHLVITHHRPVKFEDLISVYIYFYNRYYLPKLFVLASAVILVEPKTGARREVEGYVKTTPFYILGPDRDDNSNYPHPIAPATVADNLIMMYNNLVKED